MDKLLANRVASGHLRSSGDFPQAIYTGPIMPADQEILDLIKQSEELSGSNNSGDSEIAELISQAETGITAHRNRLRDSYVWGLVAPLSGTRQTYAKKVTKEITDPTDRRWLVEEVARVAKMQEWAQKKEYNESGYLGRFGKNAQKVGGAFADASTGMIDAAGGLRDWIQGKGNSAEDVKFLRALESAKRAENPFSSQAPGISGKAATGASGMAPDLAAGLLANAAGGPPAAFGYWTARQFPERREDYLEMGLNPGTSTLAGAATAGAEGAIELINIDPTGLTKGVATPVKGAIRRGITKAAEKVGGKTLKSFAKHPVSRRAVGAGLEAIKRTGLETLEEGLQGATQEGGKYLAEKAISDNPQRTLGGVLSEGVSQAVEAAPGIAVLGGVGGAARAGEAVGRFRKIAEGTKHARIQAEIIQADAKKRTPSRKQWKAWGLPADQGMSIKNRREAVKRLANGYRELEQVRAVLSGVTPTAEQWKQLGLPGAKGKTKELRRAFLQEKFAQPAPAVQQEAVSPEQQQQVEPKPETSQPVEQSTESKTEPTQQSQGISPARHDFSVEMEGTGKAIGGREVVRKLEQIWGAPIRAGRIGNRAARGIYKLKSQVSRLAKGEEASIAVAIHEALGHHLDNTTDILKSAPQEAKRELRDFDYDQTQRRAFEGFAEFTRAYLTGASVQFKTGVDLQQAAPKFLAHLTEWLDAHSDVKAKMEASRAPIEAFRQAGAVGRVKGQISKTGVDEEHSGAFRERVNELKEFLYTKIKDEGRPIKRFSDEAKKLGYDPGKKVATIRDISKKLGHPNSDAVEDTTPFEDYNALRQIGPHFAAQAIERGVFKLGGNMEQVGPSLREALAEINAGEDYGNFIAWAYARHAVESWHKGKNPGVTITDAEEAYKRLYSERFEKAANKLTEFNNALIVVLADVGAIDTKSAAKILSMYETYIPLERAKKGFLRGRDRGGRRMVDLSAAIKGRRGSGLQIIDPVEASLARAIRLYERAAQQMVTNKLITVAREVKGLGGWVEEVPAKVVATRFSIEEIKGQLLNAARESPDFSIEDVEQLLDDGLDPAAMLTIWRPDLMRVHGVPIVRVVIDGKPRFFQMHPELAESLGGLETLQNLDIATRTARAFTGILKIGATRLNPDFILSNAARDFQTFLMQGEKGLTGAFDPAQYAAVYVVSEIQKRFGKTGDPVVKIFQKMGGELSTWAGMDRAWRRAGISRALAGKPSRWQTASNIIGTSEVAPRLAEFSAILKKEGWLDRVQQGETPPMPVLVRAINAAHDVTVDFRRMGPWGRYLNYYLPFFNARLEGADKFTRTFKDYPKRSILRVGMNIVPLALVYWWYRHDDDDYKERPRWQDSFFVLKDSEGNPAWRIPKSQEWGVIESGVERMMDAMYDKDPEAVSRWFEQALSQANPGTYPAGVTPFFESQFNFDSFRDRPIVSAQLQKLEAPDQYYEYTSKFAKAVARKLHAASNGKISLSPAKIDHLANGLMGGLYGKVSAPVEKALNGESWNMSDVPGLKGLTLRKDYAKSIDDFYTRKEALDKSHESKKLHKKEIQKQEAVEWRRMQYVSSLMTDIRKAARKLPAAERSQTELAMVGLARTALGKEPLDRYRNPIASLDAVPGAVQAVIRKHIASKAITASSGSRLGYWKANNAWEYLRDMGVDGRLAQDLAYQRLRSLGVKSDTAKVRVGVLRQLFP